MDSKFEDLYWGLVKGIDISSKIENLLIDISNNSHFFSPTWHALGFVHCELFKKNNSTLRLHIWPKNLRNIFEQKDKIHNHIFSLHSYIVCGEIENLYYKLINEVDLDKKYFQLYKVKYKEKCSILEPTGNYFLPILTESFLIKSNNIYKINRGLFHESRVDPSKLVCTLVATYDFVEEDPHMLGNFCEKDQVIRVKVPFPIEEWQVLIRQVIGEVYFEKYGDNVGNS
ncbi:hypothetical protein ACT4ZR_13515 [Acinetobacter baumannii]